ncbi:AAA family ATPase [Spongorhabdus nitratireducens]
MKLKQKIEKLVNHLTDGLHEREEIVSVALLAALAGQNTFLYGPPGTAKSLISRRIACAFTEPKYFEYLMNRFSTPEEVFGPVSIKALKEDQYIRKTNGYLPTANFAFLDEIWKSSPAVLNTLLTLINERLFRNGEDVDKAPLKALIAASNETPAEGQGLEALYDRFIIRMMVPPMQSREKFEALLQSKPVLADITIPEAIKFTSEDWADHLQNIEEVSLSQESLTIISLIRIALAEKSEELDVYVSDRRWQKAALLMKASAMFCGRRVTNHSDALLLRHCLWTSEENRQAVIRIVENAVRECGIDPLLDLSKFDVEKERLEKEIEEELYHTDDVYKTITLGDGQEYFEVNAEYKPYRKSTKTVTFYIKKALHKKDGVFSPVDERGQEIGWVRCDFDKQGSCSIETQEDHNPEEINYWNESEPFKPEILFTKGSKKNKVNKRLISSLKEDAIALEKGISESLNLVKDKQITYEEELKTPFVPYNVMSISIEGVNNQINDLNLRLFDCERLIALCK